jgi:hypothetical protein
MQAHYAMPPLNLMAVMTVKLSVIALEQER